MSGRPSLKALIVCALRSGLFAYSFFDVFFIIKSFLYRNQPAMQFSIACAVVVLFGGGTEAGPPSANPTILPPTTLSSEVKVAVQCWIVLNALSLIGFAILFVRILRVFGAMHKRGNFTHRFGSFNGPVQERVSLCGLVASISMVYFIPAWGRHYFF